jgi:hypothetical protein
LVRFLGKQKMNRKSLHQGKESKIDLGQQKNRSLEAGKLAEGK